VGTAVVTRARGFYADNGLTATDSPGIGFETDPSGEPEIERVGAGRRVETKGQARNRDLVMVAKASLRESERPLRVFGSGRIDPPRMRLRQ
jgi:hypothetical protein